MSARGLPLKAYQDNRPSYSPGSLPEQPIKPICQHVVLVSAPEAYQNNQSCQYISKWSSSQYRKPSRTINEANISASGLPLSPGSLPGQPIKLTCQHVVFLWKPTKTTKQANMPARGLPLKPARTINQGNMSARGLPLEACKNIKSSQYASTWSSSQDNQSSKYVSMWSSSQSLESSRTTKQTNMPARGFPLSTGSLREQPNKPICQHLVFLTVTEA